MKDTDTEILRKWLIDSRGNWMEIARRSHVSLRTLSNIVSGTYEAPRQLTLRALDGVRRKMTK